jgi:hypothetical protein
VQVSFIPLKLVKKIYVGGGKGSIQQHMVSAIVTSIQPRATMLRQMATLDRLRSQNPDMVDSVAQQLAKLTTERQNLLLNQGEAATAPEGSATDQPTFASLGGRNQGSPAPTMERITSLTATAPTRNGGEQLAVGSPVPALPSPPALVRLN